MGPQMAILQALSQGVERALAGYTAQRERAKMERLTELQFARHMRNRSEPGSTDFYYYNAIVKRCGGV